MRWNTDSQINFCASLADTLVKKDAMKTYIVTQRITLGHDVLTDERIVDAPSEKSAIKFVASDTITARVATTDDLIRLVLAGVGREFSEGLPVEKTA